MIEKYVIDITDAMQVPAIVYEVRERAKKKALYLLLVHKEPPNIVRGTMQPLEKQNGVIEVKRPDGGFSWYHGGTYCLMFAEPSAAVASKASEYFQDAWGARVKHFLAAFSSQYGTNVVYRNSDLFVGPDEKHLVGMSCQQGDSYRVQRACWYERDPISDITDLLRADGIDPKNFAAALQVVEEGFFGYLVYMLKPLRKSAHEFISQASMVKARDLQRKRGYHHARGSCVLGPNI